MLSGLLIGTTACGNVTTRFSVTLKLADVDVSPGGTAVVSVNMRLLAVPAKEEISLRFGLTMQVCI
jgi:uncharacterized lipoprotein YmbA